MSLSVQDKNKMSTNKSFIALLLQIIKYKIPKHLREYLLESLIN